MDGSGVAMEANGDNGSCSGGTYTTHETLGSCRNRELKTGRCRRSSSPKGGDLAVARHSERWLRWTGGDAKHSTTSVVVRDIFMTGARGAVVDEKV
jgi:hypothetical protein